MNDEQTSMGQDSFLDIVANLVGILIILVVVVGAQAQSSWQQSEAPAEYATELESVKQDVEKKGLEAINLQGENAELHRKLDYEKGISSQLAANRRRLLLDISRISSEIKEQQLSLDQQQLEANQLRSHVEELKHEIDLVKYEFSAVENQTVDEVEVLKHYPTPIAKTVFSDEIHFRIKNGRIAYVPMEDLLNAMRNEWKVKARKLQSTKNTWESVGPISGFRLAYLLALKDSNRSSLGEIEFRRFEINSLNDSVGEEISLALQENSGFRSRLERFVADRTTVSLWVYPDEYEDLIGVRDWLRQNRFQTASWPLQKGQPISGGPQGLRTSTN